MRSTVSDKGSDIEYYVGQSTYKSDDKLVIALEFGTTFNSIGYAFANEDKPDICSIKDWPGLEGRRQPKVPTVICYDPESEAGFTWGAESHKREIIRDMKLLLDSTQATPAYLPTLNTGKELERLGKPNLDVIADLIGAIYEHALTIIEDKIPRDYLEMCQKQFVLSFLAVWSDRAKDLTMKVSDAFIICDAGGGTVDLISYEIMRLAPNFELKELVLGNSGMAGSSGLNK
ncbi:hypothetical protein DID88_000233 [Monilinia fructigena]|uniref:Uncharacterized protein n=1 Tax=Monilinia fructigena TaxID=38457 RepID=A0A395ILR2_9HELO|nr:hypothetical protein DID88_000233 [Monilinia fructigena]